MPANLMFDIADEDVQDAHGNLPAIDFHALYAAGFRVAVFRCASCYFDANHGAWRLYHDKTFDTYAAAARAAGIVVGAYVFVAFNLGAPAPAEQIANAVACSRGLTSKDLPMALDVEFPGSGLALTKRTPAEVAALLGQFVDEIEKQTGRLPVTYTSHVIMNDDNELDGAVEHLPDAVKAKLASTLLWQKVPYRLAAGHPLDPNSPTPPHDGHVTSDPNDYWRTPAPWEGRSAAMLVQTQGDVRGLPGGLHQADVGYIRVSAVGDRGNHVTWIRQRLASQGGTSFSLVSATNVQLDVSNPVFDADLAAVVIAFQKSRNLVADGIVGAATIAALA